MSQLQEYINVIGGFQGCLLFVLLFVDSRMTTASRILGVTCLVIASVFLLPFLLMNAETKGVASTIGWVFYLPAMTGALAYLYCRSALLDKHLSARDFLHFIPWLVCYALTADIFITQPQHMADWAMGANPQTWRLQASEVLLFVQAFVYAGLSMLLIWRYRKHANATLANFNPLIFRWLLILQVFTIAVWFLKALPAFSLGSSAFSDLANLLLVLLIYFIAFMQWRNPQVFTISSLSEEQEGLRVSEAKEGRPSQDGELDPTTRAKLFETVRTQVEDRQLYLNSELTLTSLARATGLSKHHLSEVINKHANKNFYEFLNGYRIDFVRARLEERDNQKIIDIAFEAGFTSKSTFNAIFKQFTQLTPTQYRKNLELKNA